MTEPSQYFKGRTVQEQMNEVIGYVDTRAAEVATTAIASDVAQVHQDMLDADADAQAAAASAAAAAGTLANAVKKTGEASQSIAGDIAISGDLSASGTTQLVDVAVSTTIEVPTPTTNADAANKKYVDDADALKINITDINSYAIGLTGNQVKQGGLSIYGSSGGLPDAGNQSIYLKNRWSNITTNNAYNSTSPMLVFLDNADNVCAFFHVAYNSDHTATLVARVRNSDGTYKTVLNEKGDVI